MDIQASSYKLPTKLISEVTTGTKPVCLIGLCHRQEE
jgi:hypothetical protein